MHPVSGCVRWQLTFLGVKQIQHWERVAVSLPVYALRSDILTASLASLTAYELLQRMEMLGWTCCILKKGHRGPPPYEVGSSPLTWYVGGSGQGHVCKPYLAALLQASSLLHVGVGEIPHLAHAKRYRAMLKLLDAKGHAPALARPASQIECDVDMDGSLCVANVNVDVGTGSAEAAKGSDSDSDLGEAGSDRTTSNGETSEDSYHEASDLAAPPMAAPLASESFEEVQVLPQSELPEPEGSLQTCRANPSLPSSRVWPLGSIPPHLRQAWPWQGLRGLAGHLSLSCQE